MDDQEARSVQFMRSQTGRLISYQGLVERIIEQFNAEYDDNHPSLIEADNDVKRRRLLKPVADYVFAVESVQLTLEEQAHFLRLVCSELFTYGGLDALFADSRVTTISLEGAEKLSVRYAPAEDLQALDPIFEDGQHARRVVARLLRHAGTDLSAESPFVEAGLLIQGRPVNLNVAVPPYVNQVTADIRVHPTEPIQLIDFVQAKYMDERSAHFLRALAQSEHGFIIVGDTESGKTSLLNALLADVPESGLAVIERAYTLRLPEAARRYVVQWQAPQKKPVTWAERIQEAVQSGAKTLVLDEVRADDEDALAPLLSEVCEARRQIWTFRGSPDPLRLRSALGMMARIAQRSAPEAAVYALYERLPFVVVMKRRKTGIHLMAAGEWRWHNGSADYVPLMEYDGETARWTSKAPQHALALSADFWS